MAKAGRLLFRYLSKNSICPKLKKGFNRLIKVILDRISVKLYSKCYYVDEFNCDFQRTGSYSFVD